MRKSLFVMILIAVTLCLAQPSHAANPRVTIKVTGAVTGDIIVELYQDKAPITVNNFLNYAQSGFYNGLIFHRVIKKFMIQGGGFDPNMVEKATNYPIINESTNGLSNLRYTIAMARTTHSDSATSQFFINTDPNNNPELDPGGYYYDPYYSQYYGPTYFPNRGYCVFGKVVSGTTVVNSIEALTTTTKNGYSDVPASTVKIQSVVVSTSGSLCMTKMQGDINGDCKVNLIDMALLSSNWLKCNSTLQACP